MSDYDKIAKAIDFINRSVNDQPSLDQVAAHLSMSRFHFQRLFSRWVGVTPKKYLQVLTVERAKALLDESKPLLDVSDALGLSSGSRLYDHFVNIEAVTPGEYKTKGEGVVVQYSIQSSPFGNVFIASTPRGICRLSFVETDDVTHQIEALREVWPKAVFEEKDSGEGEWVQSLFSENVDLTRPLSLHVAGTNFQVNVWRALLEIPYGAVVSYTQIAQRIGKPGASRAVGSAIGANPAAFLIPCHRVIRQDGKLGGYRWGETRKHAIHAWESAKLDAKS